MKVCRRPDCGNVVEKPGPQWVYCSQECGFVDRLFRPQPMDPITAGVFEEIREVMLGGGSGESTVR